jgi:hypothetical protein
MVQLDCQIGSPEKRDSMSTSSFSELTCFISAGHGAERSQLRKRLEDRKVTCFSLDRIEASSGPTVSVQSLIQRSDFVAAILPSSFSPNIAFELGMALGLGKPLLLFAHRASSVPFDLASMNILQIDRLDQTKWDDYIEAFLRTIPRPKIGTKRSSTRNEAHSSRRWKEIRTELDRLLADPGPSFEREFESLVQRGFKQGGFSLTSSPGPDFGADFALASPKLIEAFSLPVLIEVKNNLRNELAHAPVARLSALIRQRRGGAGLIVTARAHNAVTRPELIEPILIMPVRELFDWLQKGLFEKEFIDEVEIFWTREQ